MTSRLHIAVDAHDLARDDRGIGRYARALLSRFVRREDVRLTLLVRSALPFRHARALRAAIGADARVAVAGRVPRDADVVWHPWNGLFFESDVPALATLHDVIPFAFPASSGARRASQQAPFLRTAARADLIVADSEFTAAEARRYLAIDADRIETIPLGVDVAFSPGATTFLPLALRGRTYVLFVGAHDPHKNVETLVSAFDRSLAKRGIDLVFTRPRADCDGAIVVRGLDTDALVAAYRGALLVAVPSLYEGFGLPVLEAMACGTPVLAARCASLPEVGGDAVCYVSDPRDVAGWADAMDALASDPTARADLADRGFVRARSFTWDACARRTFEALRRTAQTR